MKPWRETITLGQPLRDIRLNGAPHSVDLERRIQEREKECYERGWRAGERALSEQLVRQRADLLELQNGVLKSLRSILPQTTRDCENALVSLAFEVASRLVAGLPVSPEMVEGVVKEALARVEEAGECLVQLHSEDLALLQKINSPILLSDVGGAQLRFESSTEVTRGGCRVETRFGSVDAQRETKLEILKKTVQDECT